MNKKVVSFILGIMCFILTYGICMQVKTIDSMNSTITTSTTQNKLRDSVLKMKEKYETAYKQSEELESKLEEARKTAVSNNTSLESLEEQINEANKLLGLTDVTGQGIIIKIADSDSYDANSVYDVSTLLVHDLDLIMIIEELKNAGAEAISINDQRIVSTTAIECDGNVIKINGEKIGSPFVIKAIGLPEYLAGLQRPGGQFLNIQGY
jgi:uncharacterized protein YlxW (UPF0749 family)